MNCLLLHRFFILLDPVWCWCSLLHFFYSLLFCSTKGFVWFLNFFSVKSYFVHILFSWFCWFVFNYFLVAHWLPLKELFWIPYQANHRSLLLWSQLQQNCVPSLVSCFNDFSCSLKPCFAVFVFEEAITSSSLYW